MWERLNDNQTVWRHRIYCDALFMDCCNVRQSCFPINAECNLVSSVFFLLNIFFLSLLASCTSNMQANCRIELCLPLGTRLKMWKRIWRFQLKCIFYSHFVNSICRHTQLKRLFLVHNKKCHLNSNLEIGQGIVLIPGGFTHTLFLSLFISYHWINVNKNNWWSS